MAKRARESDVAETMEEVIEKVQSQAATIRDLEEKLKRQVNDCRELRELYTSRYDRLQERYRMCSTFWLRLP